MTGRERRLLNIAAFGLGWLLMAKALPAQEETRDEHLGQRPFTLERVDQGPDRLPLWRAVTTQDVTQPPAKRSREDLRAPTDANDDPFEVHAVAGGIVTFGSDAGSAITPTANIEAEGPLVVGKLSLGRIGAEVLLTTAPGDSLNLADPATFRAGGLRLFAARVIGRRTTYRDHDGLALVDQDITTEGIFVWGFASRMDDGESVPAKRLVRHYGFGLRFRERVSRTSLTVLYGRDEGGGPRGWGQWIVRGTLPVPATKGTVVLIGDATLSVGPENVQLQQQDTFRIGVGVDIKQVVDAVDAK